MDARKIKQLERPLSLDFYGEKITIWYRPGATSYNWHESKNAELKVMTDKLQDLYSRLVDAKAAVSKANETIGSSQASDGDKAQANADKTSAEEAQQQIEVETKVIEKDIKTYVGNIICEIVSKWDIELDGKPLPVSLETYMEWIPEAFGEYMWEQIRIDSRPKSKTSGS